MGSIYKIENESICQWTLSYQEPNQDTYSLYTAPANSGDNVPPADESLIEWTTCPDHPCSECWKEAAEKAASKWCGKDFEVPETSNVLCDCRLNRVVGFEPPPRLSNSKSQRRRLADYGRHDRLRAISKHH